MAHDPLPPALQRRIADASAILADAERELDRAIQEIGAAERADKTIITAVVQAAFVKLAAARSNLDELLRDDS